MSRFLSENAKRWKTPSLKKNVFDVSTTHPLTTDIGKIIPVFCEPISANSALSINPTFGFDSLPFVANIQCHIKANLAYFYVRNRTLWDNFQRFAMTSPIAPTVDVVHPFISREHWTGTGTLSDYFGIPCNTYSAPAEQASITINGFGGFDGSNQNAYGTSHQSSQFVNWQKSHYDTVPGFGYYRQSDWSKDTANVTKYASPFAGVGITRIRLGTQEQSSLYQCACDNLQQLIDARNNSSVAPLGNYANGQLIEGATKEYSNYYVMEQPIKQTIRMNDNEDFYPIVIHHLQPMLDGDLISTDLSEGFRIVLYTGTSPSNAYKFLTLNKDGSLCQRVSTPYTEDHFITPADGSSFGAGVNNVYTAPIDNYRIKVSSADVDLINSKLDSGNYVWIVVYQLFSGLSGGALVSSTSLSGFDKPFPYWISSFPASRAAAFGLRVPLGCQTGLNVSKCILGYTPKVAEAEAPSIVGGVVDVQYLTTQNVVEVNNTPFDGLNPLQPISALPFRAYEAIYNSHFRPRLLDPFRKDGKIAIDDYVTNHGDGADSTTPVTPFRALYAEDYFTSCLNTPMGNDYHEQVVGAISDGVNTNIKTVEFTGTVDGQSKTFTVNLNVDENDRVHTIDSYSENTDKFTLDILKEGIKYGITSRAITMADALNKWFEASFRGGRYSYSDFVNAHFGHPATHYIQNKPEYLGGFTEDMQLNEVTNTNAGTSVASTSEQIPLGYSIAKGSWSKGKKKPIKCYADEEGFVIGVMWFSCEPINNQSIRKFWYRSQPSDYPTPELANLGTMEVTQREINPLQCTFGPDGNALDTFGYQRNYGDLLTAFDFSSGRFKGDMSHYLLQRVWNLPTLSREFCEQDPSYLNNVWAESENNKDKIFGYIHHDTKRMIWLNQSPNQMIM